MARRLLLVACVTLLTGVLAVPAKRSIPPDREHLATADNATTEPLRPIEPWAGLRALSPAAPAGPAADEQPIVPPSGDVVAVEDASQTAAADAAGQAAPPSAADDVAARSGNGVVWAFVVGINDYPGDADDLRSAVADATDMVRALNSYGVEADHVILADGSDATGSGILRGLDWLVDKAQPNDTAVFFYAGHARKLDRTTEAVVGADGRNVPDWLLAEHLAGLQAHDAWIVMAACYGGGFTELLQPGRALTAAAGADDLAYESQTFGRSYLGEYLVRRGMLLHGAGPTAQQAFQYAQSWLQREHPDRVLTEIDESTAPISLDGVHRDRVPAPQQPAPPPTTAPPAPPPSAPPPKSCVLVVVCSG